MVLLFMGGQTFKIHSILSNKNSLPPFFKKIRLRFPFTISPSPKRNVSILNNTYYVVDKEKVKIISKSKLKAYFSSIEI